MQQTLSPSDRETALAGLNGWIYDPAADAISHDFRFTGFSEAFAFMTRIALLAERADHHPDIANSYDRVRVTLSTHSAGGLTDRDIALAGAIDGLLHRG
ncbi:MAG: 4a-hydroxytetrahydrobiopterin dehydratase [Devosia sp.]|nr:4a-hydroxytetrahydrobiopterin dehydratase [Devosia sp.]